MKRDVSKELIRDIIDSIQVRDKQLLGKVHTLISFYEDEKNLHNKLQIKHANILKKYDRRSSPLTEGSKDKIIEQQSRLAAMGEMIDAVAHQWKQPLNAISMMLDLLQDDFLDNDVDKAYIKELDENVHLQIDYMLNTLNEFRNFLRPSTKNESFFINTIVHSVQILMKDELISQNIPLNIEIDETLSLFGNKNEFKHLFINIINNAIDAFNERCIKKRHISIRAYHKQKYTIIEIEDNAGGIPNNIIEHIFKPNITSKADGKGTGIGLYMCQQIINKYNGNINVTNKENGALFTVSFRESTI